MHNQEKWKECKMETHTTNWNANLSIFNPIQFVNAFYARIAHIVTFNQNTLHKCMASMMKHSLLLTQSSGEKGDAYRFQSITHRVWTF